MVSDQEVDYYCVTLYFPTMFFSLIVLYLFFKDRFKRR